MTRRPLTELERARLEDAADHHDKVAADLRDVLEHGWPDPDELDDAPTIDGWSVESIPAEGLVGEVVLGITTQHGFRTVHRFRSVLYAHSVAAGVARVNTRWVGLGEPKEEEEGR